MTFTKTTSRTSNDEEYFCEIQKIPTKKLYHNVVFCAALNLNQPEGATNLANNFICELETLFVLKITILYHFQNKIQFFLLSDTNFVALLLENIRSIEENSLISSLYYSISKNESQKTK